MLAHALRDRAEVVLLDRDAGAADTGGYRIALTPEAVRAVRRHVPASIVERLAAVSDSADTFAQFTIADAALRPIVIAPEPPGQERMLCQRRAMRVLLAEGLDIRFGTAVVGARPAADGAAVLLADGSSVHGDLVVAADGPRSAVVESVHPGGTSADLALTGIAGSVQLLGDDVLPWYLAHGPALALDHRGTGMFLSRASSGLGAVPPELAEAVGPPSLVWGLIARRAELPELRGASPDALSRIAADAVRDWHPWMRRRVLASDPARTAWFSFRAASVDGERFPWRASRITAIGDAVHAMPPTGGRAGSTAILSAAALAEALLAHADVDAAVAEHRGRVDAWAVPAIRESLGPVRAIRALGSTPAQLVARPALALAGALGAARHRRRGRQRTSKEPA